MKRHLVIGDLQIKPGVPVRHLEWIGQAINDYKPDVVVNIGDTYDMESLSSYDSPGSLKMEGKRYEADIVAGNEAFDILNRTITHKCKKYYLYGNHEQRIERAINKDPRLLGTIGYKDFQTGSDWKHVPYDNGVPGQIEIDQIRFAHFFANPNTGKPIGGTIQNLLKNIGTSCCAGHRQGLSRGEVQFATGKTINGTVCGSSYLHDEGYKGQANFHWRGIVVLNEVENGGYSDMALSLNYLSRKYEGMSVSRYLNKNYRGAKERFSLARVVS